MTTGNEECSLKKVRSKLAGYVHKGHKEVEGQYNRGVHIRRVRGEVGEWSAGRPYMAVRLHGLRGVQAAGAAGRRR